MIAHGNFTSVAPPLLANLPAARRAASFDEDSDVWYVNQLDFSRFVHSGFSREDVIRCIWLDRIPVSDDSDFDIAPLTNYIM